MKKLATRPRSTVGVSPSSRTTAAEPSDKKIDTHVKPDFFQGTQQKSVNYTGALDLAPGEYTVRFVVRDDLNGRIGSVAAPLKIE